MKNKVLHGSRGTTQRKIWYGRLEYRYITQLILTPKGNVESTQPFKTVDYFMIIMYNNVKKIVVLKGMVYFMEFEKFIEVGEYIEKFNVLTGESLPKQTIYMSKGLHKHLLKRKHFTSLKYIENIPDIIKNPDYIGKNPNEPSSIELIKVYEKNMLLGLKLNIEENYIYVSTIHDIQEQKLQRRLHSGRIKQYKLTT